MSGSPAPETVTDLYSDIDLADPSEYYGGYKKAAVTRFGVAEHIASDKWTGELKASTFQYSISDTERLIRPQLVSQDDKYWSLPTAIRMTTRDNRAELGLPETVFVGTIIEAQPTAPLGWDITLGDAVAQGLLSDEMQLPYRVFRDSFPSLIDEFVDSFDLDTPEPIIYGEHRRVPDVDPASPQGFVYTPQLIGKQTISGQQYWVWLVCGHAVSAITDVFVNGASVLGDEGTIWLIPGYGGWNAEFGASYVDYPSDTYPGVQRRFTLIYGLFGMGSPSDPQNDADRAAFGGAALTVAIEGVEDIGDGTGALITDRFQQYKHFAINYLANQGQNSYQSGDWLTNPVWALIDGDVDIVDEASFDDCTLIGEFRLPSVGSPATVAGYIGAFIIGAKAGDRDTARRWIADWNRSCSCQFVWTLAGQMRIFMLSPTAQIKHDAPLFTDATEILAGTFTTKITWAQQANVVPFKADYEHETGQWKTQSVVQQDVSIERYGVRYLSEIRDYPAAPGITMASHLAQLESIIRQDPPRMVILATNVDDDKAGVLNPGDYFTYLHYAAVGNPSQIRLVQVQRTAIDVGNRMAFSEALDCNDYVGYDTPEIFDIDALSNTTCDTAIDIPDQGTYTIVTDVTGRTTDSSVSGFCGTGIAYVPAWWKRSPPFAEKGFVTTGQSLYDTVLTVWRIPTGDSCSGALSLVACNDDDVGIFKTSFIEIPFMDPAYDYYFLATGKDVGDEGRLNFTFFSEPL